MKKISIQAAFVALLLCSGCNFSTAIGSFSQVSAASGSTSASASSAGKVQLNWSAGSGSPTGYLVEQSANGSVFSQVQSVTSTSATISGLTAGSVYYFRVRAYNSSGNSAYSSIVSIQIPSG